MKVICAWCGVTLRDDGKDKEIVSHGICAKCAKGID